MATSTTNPNFKEVARQQQRYNNSAEKKFLGLSYDQWENAQEHWDDDALGFGGFSRVIGSVWNNLTGVTEQREYEKQLSAQQMAYDSPQAQLNRLMQAGYSERQARDILGGSSGASGQSANIYSAPSSGGAMGAIGSAVGIGNMLASTANVNAQRGLTLEQQRSQVQDTAQKKITNKYIGEQFKLTLEGMQTSNSIAEINKRVQALSLHLEESSAPLKEKAIIGMYAKSVIENMPAVDLLKPENQQELSTYMVNRMCTLLAQSESDRDSAKFREEMNEWALEHIVDYQETEYNRVSAEKNAYAVEGTQNQWFMENADTIEKCFKNNLNFQLYQSEVAKILGDKWMENKDLIATTIMSTYLLKFKNDHDAEELRSIVLDHSITKSTWNYIKDYVTDILNAVQQGAEIYSSFRGANLKFELYKGAKAKRLGGFGQQPTYYEPFESF